LNRAADAPAFARALSQAGYATDPDYHGKIERILDSARLRDAVSGARQSQSDTPAEDEV
jgi:flagellum-specific peptidoglycan hydrolase FlgJ